MNVSLRTAKLAKEKGYAPKNPTTNYVKGYIEDDIYENGFYETEIQEEDYDRGDYYLAPLQYELQKWLREKHKLHIIITLGHDENSIWHDYSVLLMDKSYDYNPLASSESGLSSYEEALEAALCDGLNLIKNEN